MFLLGPSDEVESEVDRIRPGGVAGGGLKNLDSQSENGLDLVIDAVTDAVVFNELGACGKVTGGATDLFGLLIETYGGADAIDNAVPGQEQRLALLRGGVGDAGLFGGIDGGPQQGLIGGDVGCLRILGASRDGRRAASRESARRRRRREHS